MGYEWISYASPYGDPNYQSLVNSARENMIDYLNNYFDQENVDFTFYSYDYGDIPINAAEYGESDGQEELFAKDCLDYLANNDGLSAGEIVVIPHGKWAWGYGHRYPHSAGSDGISANACLVFAGAFNTSWEAEGFTWHEIAHALGASHGDGSYKTQNGDEMYGISPMCMAYLYDSNDEVDTRFPGDADEKPPDFCFNDNDTGEYYYGYKKDNHDLNDMGSCALNSIVDWARNHS